MLYGTGKTTSYRVKSEEKLKRVAAEYGVKTDGRKSEEIAADLGRAMLEDFGKQESAPLFINRAPKKQQNIWKKLNIIPNGIDRPVVETMSMTNIGVDNDYKNVILGTMKTALADGWGGSMIATEASDILFGSPHALRSKVNLGVLKNDEVNIIIHGHVPLLSDARPCASFKRRDSGRHAG
jgi:carbon-monoxide dehydrogenase catalytic subunit